MNKWLKRVLFIGIVFVGFGFIGLHFFSHKLIITPFKRESNVSLEDRNLVADRFTLHTKDSISLKGYWVKTNVASPKACIIISHGKSSNKESNLTLSYFLAEHGIESIVYDARSHGKSGGEYCTYGYYEKEDLSKIISMVKEKNPVQKIGLWGHSLGAAVTLQTMAHDPRVDFGISESAFTDLKTIVRDYQKRYFLGFRSHLLADYSLSRAEDIANFKAEEVSPLNAAKKIKQAVFLSHGTADDRIDFSYGQQLYEAVPHSNKVFYPIPDAKHNFIWQKGGPEYHKAILEFIQGQLD